MRRRMWAVVIASVVVAAGVAGVPAVSSADPPVPTIRVMGVLPEVTIERTRDAKIMYGSLGAFVAAVDGPFELLAAKDQTGVAVTQVRREADGTATHLRTLPRDPYTHLGLGLGRFLRLRWLDHSDAVVKQQLANFCPSPWSASRIDDSGPLSPTYPSTCGGRSSLTRATVWGIDRGWGVRAVDGRMRNPGIPDGTYTLQLSIAEPWAAALDIADTAPAEMTVTLKTTARGGGCPPRCMADQRTAGGTGTSTAVATGAQGAPAGPLPDLVPLPAFDPIVERVRNRDFLAFSSNVWNAGAGPLLVEGFRSSDVPEMTATQYFVASGGDVVGKEDVGTFDFDDRFNHKHWHFEDFAVYDLVPVAGGVPVRSGKQSFCLAPTDAIDLTIPGASWQTESADLGSACGGTDSIWIREALPSGWGDTYTQSRAGQAFDITSVPNGRYRIVVTTNEERRLFESDFTNNVSELEIRLRGRPGERSVSVL